MASEAQTLENFDAESTDGGVPTVAVVVAAAAAIGGIAAILVKSDVRDLREKIRRLPGAMMGAMMDHMPDQ